MLKLTLREKRTKKGSVDTEQSFHLEENRFVPAAQLVLRHPNSRASPRRTEKRRKSRTFLRTLRSTLFQRPLRQEQTSFSWSILRGRLIAPQRGKQSSLPASTWHTNNLENPKTPL